MCIWDTLKPNHQALLLTIRDGEQPPTHGIKRIPLYMLDDCGLIAYLPIENRWALTHAGHTVFEEHELCGNTAAMFHADQRVKVLSWIKPNGCYYAHWNADRVVCIDEHSNRVMLAGFGGQWRSPRFLRAAAMPVAVR